MTGLNAALQFYGPSIFLAKQIEVAHPDNVVDQANFIKLLQKRGIILWQNSQDETS